MSADDLDLTPRERAAFDALRDADPAGYASTSEHAANARDLLARLDATQPREAEDPQREPAGERGGLAGWLDEQIARDVIARVLANGAWRQFGGRPPAGFTADLNARRPFPAAYRAADEIVREVRERLGADTDNDKPQEGDDG